MVENNIFLILIVGSLTGSALFGVLLAMDRAFGKFYVKHIYRIAKAVLLFHFGSAVAVVYEFFFIKTNIVPYESEDFKYIIQTQGLNFWLIGWVMDIISAVLFVWLFVFILLFLFSVVYSILSLRREKGILTKVCDIRLHIFNEVKRSLQIKRTIRLYEHPMIRSPYLAGIFRPMVVLPSGDYSEDQWTMFLRHELIHYKNHDLLYRLMIELVQKIHWFNPVIYAFSLKFYEMSELACDREAVEGMDTTQRGQYARLLSCAMSGNGMVRMLASFSSYQRVERRVYHIMDQKKKKVSGVFALAMVMVLAICPVASYGAVSVTSWTENFLVNEYMKKHDVILEQEECITDNLGDTEVRMKGVFVGTVIRGDNTVTDFAVKANGTVFYTSESLNEGDKLIIAVMSKNINDSYIGGISDSSGRRDYVASMKGALVHTFTITKSGEYEIFFQGRNGSGGNDIILNGTISIE